MALGGFEPDKEWSLFCQLQVDPDSNKLAEWQHYARRSTYSNNDVGDVACLCKIAQSLDGVVVTNDFFKFLGPVFFDPKCTHELIKGQGRNHIKSYHGKWDLLASAEPTAGAFLTGESAESTSIVSTSDMLK